MSGILSSIYSQFNLSVASDSEKVVYVFEDFRLVAGQRMLYRGGEELALTPKAVETLLALVERRGEIVHKDELMRAIWGETIVDEANLSHQLHVLRKALGSRRDGRPFIETFRRRGYRFDADVEAVEEAFERGPFADAARELKGSDLFAAGPARGEHGPADDSMRPDSENEPPARRAGRSAVFALTLISLAAVSAVLSYLQTPVPPRADADARPDVSIVSLTNGAFTYNATISRDGKYFVYYETDGELTQIFLQQTGQSTRIEIVPAAPRSIGGITFSPNGEFVYFVALERSERSTVLYRVPKLGGPISKILSDVDSPVSFSPDGAEFVFVRHSTESGQSALVAASVDGADERILITRGPDERLSTGGPDWSPDGKLIAFGLVAPGRRPTSEGACSIEAFDVETGRLKPLSPERWDNCFRIGWVRGGEGFFFIGTREGEGLSTRRDQVYYVDAATGAARRVTTDDGRYQDLSLGVTDDNAVIAVPSNRISQIWVVGADGDARTARQITSGAADGRGGIAALPDGRVGYTARIGESLTIWVMNADGTDQRQIGSDFQYIEELRASPDGRYFVFSARRSGLSHLYRIDPDGSNLRQLTDGLSNEIDSSVSPDGRWIVHDSNVFENGAWRPELRRTSSDGRESHRFGEPNVFGFVPHYSPDGRLVSGTVGPRRVQLLRADDGRLVRTIETVEHSSLNLGARWTPDGDYLTYIVFRKNAFNVWRQPLSGPARPLTNFPQGDIYNYAFSHDGARLYLARGYQLRNVLLIKNFK